VFFWGGGVEGMGAHGFCRGLGDEYAGRGVNKGGHMCVLVNDE